MTVSVSIPAAVASMAILRLFRNFNILVNNIVQTAAPFLKLRTINVSRARTEEAVMKIQGTPP